MLASWSRRDEARPDEARPDEARPDEGSLTVLLAIDVRNTHTVVGLLSGSGEHAKVVQQWRIRTESEVTADELALTIDGLIGDDADQLTGAAALSTVPSVLHEVRVMLGQYWPSVPHVLIEPGVRTGIPLLVDNPKEVGADRIINCLAAFQKYGTAAIVIDFGSSICVDVVSAKGEFLGGAIAPGIQVSSDAAAARSAALRRVELARPRSVVGKNTVECMQAGAVFGFAGLVDGLVRRIREDVEGFAGDDVAIVATGHTAPLLLPELHTAAHYDQHLTLHGLRLVFERNRDPQRGRLKTAR
jgi:type III pantothenate kinase